MGAGVKQAGAGAVKENAAVKGKRGIQAKPEKERELEIYIHIPFCVRKCLYCDFLSAPADEGTRERYLEALLTEIRGRGREYAGRPVTSVFFGGGTPSLLGGVQIKGLLDTLSGSFLLARDAEITLEANPGTVDPEKLSAYARAGVNRLSIGLQSADNGELSAIGRIHTWEQFLEAYHQARQAGFANINVDLMSTLPGQSLESYCSTLKKVLSLAPPPEHISAYSLILEEGTPLYDRYQAGLADIPDEDTDRRMYQETKRMLEEAGYRRYEISNYAKEGFACRHNCGYWRRKDYLGLGLGASSMTGNVRFKNGEELSRYLRDPLGCRQDVQRLAVTEQMEEYMFLGLRLTDGVEAGGFQEAFGCTPGEKYGSVIDKNIQDGLLEYRDEGRRLALTERGLDLANYVMAQFLA